MGLAIWHSELTDSESPNEFASDDSFVEALSEDPPVLFFDVTIVLVLPWSAFLPALHQHNYTPTETPQ